MTEPGGGGDRLEVSVVADATGFARDAQAKIDAKIKKVRAKVQLQIDEKKAVAKAEAVAKAISKSVEVKLKLGVDRAYLMRSMGEAVAAFNAQNHKVKISVDVDQRQLDRALKDGGEVTVRRQTHLPPVPPPRGGSSDIDVGADTTEARAEIDRLRDEVRSDPIDVPIEIDPRQARRAGGRGLRILTQNMTGFQKFGFYAGLVQLLTSAITALGGGLFAMAGAASQAFGVLAVLPNLVGVAVQGIGALFAGFSGIGGAVQAMGQAQKAAGKAAQSSADTQAAAAERISDAQRSLAKAITSQQRTARDGDRAVADARRRVADTYAAASEKVTRAETGVANAQKAAQRAQESLNKARQDAKDALEDYQLQLSGAALDEEAAVLAVQRAQEAWNKAMRNPAATALDRKEADLALRQAEQSLAEIQDRNEDLRAEADEATKNGVEGSAAVVAAKQDVVDAATEQAESERELADARIDAAQDIADAEQSLSDTIIDTAEANIDAAEAVSDAQRALADAFREAGAGSAAANTAAANLAEAMAKLSPEGRAFAEFIAGTMRPRLEEFRNAIQARLLPGIQDMLTALNTDPGDGLGSYFDVLQDGMVDSAGVMSDVAKEAGNMLASPVFREDTKTIMDSNNRAMRDFGGAGLALMDILRNLAVAAGPQLERFAGWVRTWMEGKQAAAQAGRETGRLQAFMERAGDRAAQMTRIISNLAGAIFGLGKGGTETGDILLDKFEAASQRWDTWANSDAGQQRIAEFFENIRPLFEQLMSLLSEVTQLFVAMGEDGGGAIGGMVWAVSTLVGWFTALFQSPVGPFLSTLLAFGGAASVFSLVGGKVFGLGKNLYDGATKAAEFARGLAGGQAAADTLGTRAAAAGAKVRGLVSAAGGLARRAWTGLKDAATWMLDLGKAALKTTGRVIAQTAAWVAHKIAVAASAIASGVMTAATWLLNAAFWANPITWIVALIVGLIAIIVLLATNAFGLRDKLVAAWDFIKDKVGAAISWLWDKIKKVWDWIYDKVTGVAESIRDGVVGAFNWVKDKVVAAVEWVRDKAVAAFRWIKDKVVWYIETWRDIIVGIFTFVRDKIVGAAEWVRDKVVGAFEWVRDRVIGAAEWIRDKVVGAFERVRDGVVGAFNWIKDRVGAIWDGIRDVLSVPIRAVVDAVYNNGIRKVYNWINNLWGGDDWDEIRLAKGGVVPGYAPGRDSVRALLSPGEGVLVPEAVRGLGGAKAVQAINARYSSRVAAPPKGGDPDQLSPAAGQRDPRTGSRETGGLLDLAGAAWDATGGRLVSGIADTVGSVIDAAQDLIAEGWAVAARAAVVPVRSAIDAIPGDNGFSRGIRTGANRWIDRLLEAVGAKESENEDNTEPRSSGGSLGSTWQSLRDNVKAAIPQSRVNSSVRNTPDAHGRGKAVDFGFGTGPGGAGSAGLASIAKYLNDNYGTSLYELIYTGTHAPAGGYQIKRGRRMTYDSATRAAHTNHVHAAVYDRGGRMPHGTAGFNFSGRDEGVLTGRGVAALGGWGVLDRLNGGTSLAEIVASSGGAVDRTEPSGGVGVLIAEGAIQQTIYNPAPETPGQTLNAGLRRVAATGIFGQEPR